MYGFSQGDIVFSRVGGWLHSHYLLVEGGLRASCGGSIQDKTDHTVQAT